MGKLKVVRNDSGIGQWRKYKIFVDNVCVGVITNSETKTFEIPEGAHKVYFTQDWIKSSLVNVEVNTDDLITMSVAFNRKFSWLFPPVIPFLAVFLLVFRPFFPWLSWLTILLIPSGLMAIYFITIGRKHFFSIDISHKHYS